MKFLSFFIVILVAVGIGFTSTNSVKLIADKEAKIASPLEYLPDFKVWIMRPVGDVLAAKWERDLRVN